MRRSFGLFGVALAAVLTASSGAHADPTEKAAQIFDAAEAARRRGDNRAAALGFEEAYREAPHAAVVFNAALAWELCDEPARAADDFAAALDGEGLDPERAKVARTRLGELELVLGTLRVRTDPGATLTVAHASRRDARAPLHLAPGTYEVALALADGRAWTRSATVRAGEVLSLDAPPPPLARRESLERKPAEPPVKSGARRAVAVTLIGAGAAAFGVGAYLGVKALDARATFVASGKTDVGAHDQAASLRTTTDVVWAGAGALALTGVVLLLTAPAPKRF